MARHPTPRNPANPASKRDLFLAGLRKGLSIQGAAEGAGVDRSTPYEWRKEDEAFATAWDDAIEAGTDVLEDALLRRALTISDTAAIFLLKARRPDKYRETAKVDGILKHIDLSKLTDAQLERLANGDDPLKVLIGQ
jgi:hypothetical protein